MLKHGILGLLSYGSMTGYEIMEVFRDSLNFFWNANTSQIYRDLQTLKKAGFVTDKLIPQKGKPDKKEFSITEAGKAELKKWLCDYTDGITNFPLLMKVFFSGEINRENNISHFKQLKDDCKKAMLGLSEVGQIIECYKQKVLNPEASLYWSMTLDFGIRYIKMIDEWCDTCIAQLEDGDDENIGD